MDVLEYELDPRGDIFLTLDNVSKDLPDKLLDITKVSGWPNELNNPAIPESDQRKPANEGSPGNKIDSIQTPECPPRRLLKIRASSKHLILACRQFERSLQPGFQEGATLRATGSVRFPIRDWEAVPFLILMLIIHQRTRMVPKQISFQRMAEIAQLVDYYECHEAVELFADLWLTDLKIKSGTPNSVRCAEMMLFISWVFNQAPAFKVSSKYLESMSTSMISFDKLPVPRLIQDEINLSRRTLITRIIESMNKLFSDLRDSGVQCSERCDCARLGALVKGMHRIGILSMSIFSTLEGISFTKLAQDCRKITTPASACGKASYNACSIYSTVDPVLKVAEKLNVGLNISQFDNLRCSNS
ncbi:hypothetical protein BDV26DRAFT_103321 [Aspergillus bertholletiae]|uniref:BTB domain-containing protein n=1 Tax=Aspergillus bertholletiae TaxID=1226010 RepID=A0A5N7AU67_9EURO|nr:hypothetical protein BDV26DRAFT_103321 [Aspergillus bertholletiae]